MSTCSAGVKRFGWIHGCGIGAPPPSIAPAQATPARSDPIACWRFGPPSASHWVSWVPWGSIAPVFMNTLMQAELERFRSILKGTARRRDHSLPWVLVLGVVAAITLTSPTSLDGLNGAVAGGADRVQAPGPSGLRRPGGCRPPGGPGAGPDCGNGRDQQRCRRHPFHPGQPAGAARDRPRPALTRLCRLPGPGQGPLAGRIGANTLMALAVGLKQGNAPIGGKGTETVPSGSSLQHHPV